MSFFSELFQHNFCDLEGLVEMSTRFVFNLLIVWGIVHFFYYPKGRRRDYYFTFLLLSVSIFMLIYLMDGSNLQIGAALGLFAVFGIIRYRTESVPIREMTYLFFLVALSVLNGTKADLSLVERLIANGLLVATVWVSENYLLVSKVGCKFVRYDNIDLIVPERYNELKADLEKRLGVDIVRVEVGAVDFLTDMTMLRVYYKDPGGAIKPVDRMIKLPKDEV
ncbi:MAG: DUF4956 domain-containing protein [Alloprevotella sp.]